MGPGSVLFFASMQPHAVQNIGDVPATYFVINWASPGSKKKQIPKPPVRPEHAVAIAAADGAGARGDAPATSAAPPAWRSASARAGASAVPA